MEAYTMTVLLIRASTKKEVVHVATKLEERLIRKGVQVVHLYGPYQLPVDPELPEHDIDLACAIGGDGTVLKAARICAARNIPIMPVKVGDFGFINEIQSDEWEMEFENFISKKAVIVKHYLLNVLFSKQRYLSVNDVTMYGAGYGTIKIRLTRGDEFINRYRCDGLVIATPTGSTAHSLSVGGPIVLPGSRICIINPIAPFTLSHRPLVLPIDKKFTVFMEEQQRTSALLVVDGRVLCGLKAESCVHIEDSGLYASILQSSRRSYFEVLRTKLGWAGDVRA